MVWELLGKLVIFWSVVWSVFGGLSKIHEHHYQRETLTSFLFHSFSR